MRGSDERTGSLFSFVDLEARVPKRHPLRKIRQIVNDALAALDCEFSRLYASEGRPSIADGKTTVDLYEAFDAIVRDEEAFRDQLRQYAEMVDGKPQITPRDIPPLVSQHLPWLKPAAKNKMFNAELVVRRSPGSLVIPTGYPTDYDTNARNYKSVEPLLAAADTKVDLVVPEMLNVARSTFAAWIGAVDPNTFLKAIEGITWITRDYYLPDKAFLQEIATVVDRWVVIAPQTDAAKSIRDLPGIGPRTVFKRAPKPPHFKLWGEPTDRKHRPAAQFVAGAIADYDDQELASWRGSNSGAVLIYPMARAPLARLSHGGDDVGVV